MTIPSTGIIGLQDIREEIYGVGYTTSKGLADCVADADPSVGSAPIGISAFRGHTQKWGRIYVENQISFTAYIYSASQGYDLITGGGNLVYTADRNAENIYVYRNTSAGNIISGDAVRIAIYYRTKQTTGSWILSAGWNNYATATYSPHSLSTNLYDYKFTLMANI